MEKTGAWASAPASRTHVRASAAEFILEGLYAHRRISRNEEVGFTAGERKREALRASARKDERAAAPSVQLRQ